MRPVGIFAALSVLAPFHASLADTQSAHDNAFVYYTDWVKTCPPADGKHVCVTRREARRQDGTFRVAIQLTEWPSKSIFYLGFPLGMRLMPGARLIVDQNEPVTARYANCDIRGCVAWYEIDSDFMRALTTGQQLAAEAIQGNGEPVRILFSLKDFAKILGGPPSPSAEVSIFPEAQKSHSLRPWRDDTQQPWLDDTLQRHLRPPPR